MAKYKFYASTGYVGSEIKETVEIPDEWLDGLSPQEQEDLLEENFREWMENNIHYGWYPAEEN